MPTDKPHPPDTLIIISPASHVTRKSPQKQMAKPGLKSKSAQWINKTHLYYIKTSYRGYQLPVWFFYLATHVLKFKGDIYLRPGWPSRRVSIHLIHFASRVHATKSWTTHAVSGFLMAKPNSSLSLAKPPPPLPFLKTTYATHSQVLCTNTDHNIIILSLKPSQLKVGLYLLNICV